ETARRDGAEVLEAQPMRPERRAGEHAAALEELSDFLPAPTHQLVGPGAREPPDHAGTPAYAAAHCSRRRAHVNASTSDRAWRAIRSARTGYSRITASAFAVAAGSSGGTTRPVSPSRTSAAMSPVAVDTT